MTEIGDTSFAESSLCLLCKSNNITWRCQDCAVDICDDCKFFHLQKNITENHVMLPAVTPCSDNSNESNFDMSAVEGFFKVSASVATVLAVNPFEAWISAVGSNNVSLYSDDGEHIRTVIFPFKVQGFSVLENKEFIISDYEGKCINKITSDGKVSKLVNTSPFSPNGIHVIRENQQFIVCLAGTGGGKLVRYSKNGASRLQTIMKNKTTGLPLFKYPRRVVQNRNGDIGTVDISLHALIVVDSEGSAKWVYKGSEESRKHGHQFDPWDICVDRDENYLVSNTGNNAVDMLNKDGRFLKYVVTNKNGIKAPLGICFDSRGTFWVGHAYGKVTLFAYD